MFHGVCLSIYTDNCEYIQAFIKCKVNAGQSRQKQSAHDLGQQFTTSRASFAMLAPHFY
jgi:hypothetical protein